MAAAVILTFLGCCAGSGRALAANGMSFGVLGGSCAPDRLGALRAAGVTVIALDLAWDRYEPQPGTVDRDYASQMAGKVAACRSAGVRVILSPGLQYPPEWVRQLPGGMFLDQHSRPPTSRAVDVVFSGAVRDAVADYYRRIVADIGLDGVSAIRIGTNATGEWGYPGPESGAEDHAYWAFGPAPQTGDGLAAGMSATPLPGWYPGTRTWRGKPVTASQAAAWYTWYSGALVDAVSWQVDVLRSAGYAGRYHLPVAGRGVLPADLKAAVAGRLDGRNDPDGALERGLDYPRQLARVGALHRSLSARSPGQGIDVDYTGLDDDTAVRARRLHPPRDSCLPSDTQTVAAGVSPVGWSGQRWTLAVARHAGLAVLGENPGPPHARFTGGSSDSDPVARQLTFGIQYAHACGLKSFLFAFEDQLFAAGSGVSPDGYAAAIAATPGAVR